MGLSTEDDDLTELLAALPAAARACRRIVWNREDAEDCTALALEQALTVRGLDAPAAFLTTVTKRRALDPVKQRERERRRIIAHHSREESVVRDETGSVDDALEAQWLWSEAQRLPPQTVAVLRLIRQGHSVSDAARHLGLTRRAAESHVLRARQRLMTVWKATLAVGVVSWRAFKRVGVPVVAGPAALAGLAIAVLISTPVTSGSNAAGAGPETSQTAVSAVRIEGLRPVPASHPHAAIEPARRTREAQRATPAPKQLPIASVGTPAGPLKVQQEDRGGADDPVGGTLKCLSEFRVTPSRIGC